jgi:hypothetical protein
MTTESETLTELDDLAAAARERGAEGSGRDRRRRVPDPRVLRAGGIVLRGTGALLVVAGFWPFVWAVLEAILLLSGRVESEWQFTYGAYYFKLRSGGWPAIATLLVWAGVTWCVAVIVFAFGHALYAIRDLVARRDH